MPGLQIESRPLGYNSLTLLPNSLVLSCNSLTLPSGTLRLRRGQNNISLIYIEPVDKFASNTLSIKGNCRCIPGRGRKHLLCSNQNICGLCSERTRCPVRCSRRVCGISPHIIRGVGSKPGNHAGKSAGARPIRSFTVAHSGSWRCAPAHTPCRYRPASVTRNRPAPRSCSRCNICNRQSSDSWCRCACAETHLRPVGCTHRVNSVSTNIIGNPRR